VFTLLDEERAHGGRILQFDLVYFELLATGQALVNSPDVALLARLVP
jgi:hypothetical protein